MQEYRYTYSQCGLLRRLHQLEGFRLSKLMICFIYCQISALTFDEGLPVGRSVGFEICNVS